MSDAGYDEIEREIREIEKQSAEAISYLRYASRRLVQLRRQLCRYSRHLRPIR